MTIGTPKSPFNVRLAPALMGSFPFIAGTHVSVSVRPISCQEIPPFELLIDGV